MLASWMRRGSTDHGRSRGLVPLLGAVLLIGITPGALAATTVRVINPMASGSVNVNVSPPLYVVNGTCHNADAVTVSVNAGPETPAVLHGAAWEWYWDLSTAPISDTVSLTVTPYLAGVAGVAEVRTVKVRSLVPGGQLALLPSSVIAGVYAGHGAVLGNPAAPLQLAVLIRAEAGAGKTIDRIKLSSSSSNDQTFTLADYKTIGNDTVGFTAIPASFLIGDKTGLAEGVRTVGLEVRSTPGGGWSNTFHRSVLIDATPPQRTTGVSAAFPRANAFVLSGVYMDAVSGIAKVDVEVTPPGGGPTTVTPAKLVYGADYNSDVAWSLDVDAAVPGTYSVVVKITDNAGNVARDPSSGTFDVVADPTAPVVTIGAPAASAFLRGDVTVGGTITPATGVAWTLLDNGESKGTGSDSPFSKVWQTTLVPDGSHTLKVEAVDGKQNKGSAEVTVTVDNTPPTSEFSKPSDSDFVSGNVQITGAVADCNLREAPDAAWVVQADTGAGWVDVGSGNGANVSAVWDTNPIAANTVCKLRILAYDKAGNDNAGTATVISVTVVKAGSVTITEPADGAYLKGSVDIKFDVAVDAIDKWELHDLTTTDVKLAEGTTTGSFTHNWDTTGKDGRHILKLFAKDKVGGTADTSIIVFVDNTDPAVAITSPEAAKWYKGVVPVNATITDANPDTWEIQIDDVKIDPPGTQAGSTVAFAWNTAPLVDGAHKVKVLATDKAGNTNAAAADSVTVNIDNTLPVVTITAPTAGQFIAAATTLTGTFVEANLEDWQWFDNGVAVGAAGTVSPPSQAWSPASDGVHVITLRVRDKAGNVAEATVTVIVDMTAPSATIDVTPKMVVAPDLFVKGAVSVVGSIADANLQTWTLTDNGGFLATGATSSVNVPYDTAGKDGTHKFELTATDKAGNATKVEITVIADNTKPVVTITAPADGAFLSGVVSLTGAVVEANLASWQWLDNGKPVAPGAPFAAVLNTAGNDGVHVVKLVATDKAGNVTDDVFVTFTADNEPPVVKLNVLPKKHDGADDFVEGEVDIVGGIAEANLAEWKLTDGGGNDVPGATLSSGQVQASYQTAGTGSLTFRLWAKDKVGQVATTEVTVIADNDWPVVSPIGLAAKGANDRVSLVNGTAYVKGTVVVSGTVSDTYLKDWTLTAGALVLGTAATANVSRDWNTTASGPGRVVLNLKGRDRIGHVTTESRTVVTNNPGDRPVVSDNTGPVVAITAPIVGGAGTPPPSVAMGSILTLIFTVNHAPSEVGDHAPLTQDGALNAPAITVTMTSMGSNFTLSLANAMTKPNLVSSLDGAATVSGSADGGYTVIWQLPILRTRYSYGKEYTIQIGGASDVLGNTGTGASVMFRVSLTR